MIITLVLIAIFFVVVASIWWFGAWSILITLVNTVIAGLTASSFYENAAHQLIKIDSSFRLLFPFIAMWLLFALTFVVLRAITDTISRYRLKLDFVTELVSRSLLSMAVGFVFVSFVAFSLHSAPLPSAYFQSSKTSADEVPNFSNTPGTPVVKETFGPDLFWAGMVQLASTGSLSYTAEETDFFPALRIGSFDEDRNFIPDPNVKVREFNRMGGYFENGRKLRSIISRQETLRVAN